MYRPRKQRRILYSAVFEHYLNVYGKYTIYNNDLAMLPLGYELSSLERYRTAFE
jgi:hypothetical protein